MSQLKDDSNRLLRHKGFENVRHAHLAIASNTRGVETDGVVEVENVIPAIRFLENGKPTFFPLAQVRHATNDPTGRNQPNLFAVAPIVLASDKPSSNHLFKNSSLPDGCLTHQRDSLITA